MPRGSKTLIVLSGRCVHADVYLSSQLTLLAFTCCFLQILFDCQNLGSLLKASDSDTYKQTHKCMPSGLIKISELVTLRNPRRCCSLLSVQVTMQVITIVLCHCVFLCCGSFSQSNLSLMTLWFVNNKPLQILRLIHCVYLSI